MLKLVAEEKRRRPHFQEIQYAYQIVGLPPLNSVLYQYQCDSESKIVAPVVVVGRKEKIVKKYHLLFDVHLRIL